MTAKNNLEAIYALSPLQEGILFHALLAPEERAYHDHIVCRLDAADGVDVAAFKTAFAKVVGRHAPLRTAFAWKLKQKPRQIVLRRVPLRLLELDLTAVDAAEQDALLGSILAADRAQPYDLARPPLVRVFLLRLSPTAFYFVFSYHHILLDAWSVPLLMRELLAYYNAYARRQRLTLPSPRPFRAYIDWLGRQDREATDAFWQRTLAGFAAPTPLAWDRPPETAGRLEPGFGVVALPPSQALTEELQGLAKRLGLTLNTLVQAAFSLLLGRLSGESDVLSGSVFSGRPVELAGVETMVGLFTNTLPVRQRLDRGKTVRAWLGEVQEHLLELRQAQWSPLMTVQEKSDVPRGEALFHAMLVFQNAPVATGGAASGVSARTAGGLEVRLVKHDPLNNFPLTLMAEPEGVLSLRLIYDRRFFDRTTIARRLGLFEHLLRQLIAAADTTRLGELSLLTPVERHQMLIEWNDSARRLDHGTFGELFAATVERAGDAIAVSCGEDEVSYRRLDERSARLAAALAAAGVGRGAVVAFLLPRGIDFLTAMLAVFRRGAAYLPLDPGHPAERHRQILARSGARCVVVEDASTDLEAVDVPVLRFADLLARAPEAAESWSAEPIDAAYVLFTSGSTGVPKGAVIEQRGMVNHLVAKIHDLGLAGAVVLTPPTPLSMAGEGGGRISCSPSPAMERGLGGEDKFRSDVIAQSASPCFDISVWQFLAALVVGGKVRVLSDDEVRDPRLLLAELTRQRVTIFETVPSLLRAILAELDEGRERDELVLRFMVPTGEALPIELCERWLARFPEVPLVNAYGPTECSDDVSHHLIRRPPASSQVPIGRPVVNMRLHVLCRGLLTLPAGSAGELAVGGLGVGRGYLGEPQRTAEIFVPDPFAVEPGARLYRTGDLARFLAAGELEFLGRLDHQVKIRGFRIELGEIETVLDHNPAVRESVVVADQRTPQEDPRLVAYVVAEPSWEGPESGDWSGAAEDLVERWQAVFDEVYAHGHTSSEDQGINLRVWVDSYTGEAFPEEQIRESVEDSVARILALAPRRLLELGCGTGLMAFRVAPHCERYCGTDLSSQALAVLERQLAARRDDLAAKVSLHVAAADELAAVGEERFDVVVLNELVQYFPDVQYLARVLGGALERVDAGGRLFVGGVRSFPHLELFHLGITLAQAAADLPLGELWRRARTSLAQDKELAVDPAFFTALADVEPRISDVRWQLKGGRSINEFTRFRYDVVVEVESDVAPRPKAWRWEDGQHLDELAERLRRGEEVLLVDVPNARLLDAVASLELARRRDPETTVGELRRAVDEALQDLQGIDPEALWRLGREHGFEVELSFAASTRLDRFDALFRLPRERRTAPRDAASGISRSAAGWDRFANRPRARTVDLSPVLREALRDQLPEYMVPAVFVTLPSLPLTSNGKIDRKALPVPERTALATAGEAAKSPTEELVLGIFAQVLGREQVAPEDHFFDRGGNSLLAIQVVSRIRAAFGVELALRAVFEAPTARQLAARLDAGRDDRLALPPVVPVSRAEPLPLSFAQQRLWVVDRLNPGSAAYNVPTAVRLEGAVDRRALERALEEIVRRHEVLRTTFRTVDDEPRQITDGAPPFALPRVDLRALPAAEREAAASRLAARLAAEPFALEHGPLLHALLIDLDDDAVVVVLVMHHIVSDAWSVGVLVKEAAALYDAFAKDAASPLPELTVQYADFAHWQRHVLAGEVLERQLGFWRRLLAGPLPVLSLPYDRPPGELPSFDGGIEPFVLSPELSRTVVELSRREGATVFMTLLAALYAWLYRVTGQSDLIVGTDVANRNRAEVENMIGFFVNLLALRLDLSGAPSFREVLRRVRELALSAYAHQDLPFDQLVSELRLERGLGPSPLFDVLFVFQNAPVGSLTMDDVRWRPLGFEHRVSRFNLALFVAEQGGVLAGHFSFRRDLFDDATVARLASRFTGLIAELAAAPDRAIDELADDAGERTSRVAELAERERRSRAKFAAFKKTDKPKTVVAGG